MLPGMTIVACLFVSGGLAQLPEKGAQPAEYAGDADDESWAYEADQQVTLLQAAYALDEATIAAVREEFRARMLLQRHYEAIKMTELRVLAEQALAEGEDSPKHELVAQKLREFTQSMPMNEDAVAGWLEQRLPPPVVQEGRPRLEELRQRREQFGDIVVDEDKRREAGTNAEFAAARQRTAELSVDEQPMPAGMKGEDLAAKLAQQKAQQAPPVRPDGGMSREPGKPKAIPKVDPSQPISKAPGREAVKPAAPEHPAAQKSPEVSPLVQAPPLDEWDRHVAAIAEKYAFSEAQVTKARAILRDLRSRAYQYRLTHADEFARAELIADSKLRAEKLRELNKAVDALFDELKQRLEALPTLEQKQKAEKPGAAKGKK